MGLSQSVAPTTEPVTLTEAKQHLRIESNDENALITNLIVAAREYVETVTRRQLVTATWVYTLPQFPAGRIIQLPKPPLSSVTSIQYVDASGDTQTFASGYYTVYTDTEPGYIELDQNENWPSTYGDTEDVTITYVAGYGGASSVPEAINVAIKLLASHWYEFREPVIAGTIVANVPNTVDALLWQYKVIEFP